MGYQGRSGLTPELGVREEGRAKGLTEADSRRRQLPSVLLGAFLAPCCSCSGR